MSDNEVERESSAAPVEIAEYALQPPPSVSRPLAVWPAVVVSVIIIPASIGISAAVAMIAGVVAYLNGAIEHTGDLTEWLNEFISSPGGLMVLLVPAQLVFLLCALVPAWLSREPMSTRLALVRGTYARWMLPVFMFGTIFVMLMSTLLIDSMFDDMSPHLEQMSLMMQETSVGWFLLLLLTISIAPGFAEELVFRGYVQRRLLQRWSPVFAIALPTVLFAVAHMDVQHSVGVLMIGLWLGLMMWRTGSVWPCIICHAFNNAVAVLLARFSGQDSVLLDGAIGIMFVVSLAAFVTSIVLLFLLKPRSDA